MRKLSSVLTNESVSNLTGKEIKVSHQLIHSYAIAPGESLSILTTDGVVRTGTWGFVRKGETRLLHVNYASAHAKPTFRMSFRNNRCLVLADSFYIWTRDKPSPLRLKAADNAPLWIPALCQDKNASLEVVIISRPARKSIIEMSQQEPVIMNDNQVNIWLKQEIKVADLINLLHTIMPKPLKQVATSRKVLIEGYDHKSLHNNYENQPSLF